MATIVHPNEIVVLGDGRTHRVLWCDIEKNTAWTFELETPKALPRRLSYDVLTATSSRPALASARQPAVALAIHATPAMLKRRDTVMERIRPLLLHPDIFEPTKRGPMVEKRAAELGCSANTLLANLREYWRGGQNSNAVLGRYCNSGRPGNDGLTGGRGSRTESGAQPYQTTHADLRNIRRYIEKFYLKSKIRTLTQTYKRLVAKAYSYDDAEGKTCIFPAGERPSFRQFEHLFYREYPIEARLRARQGKDYNLNDRARTGSVQADCQGAADIYEIDATIADIFLVLSIDRSKIIGKPTLYLIIDRGTRLIVGWYVGLENPCWAAAIQAILSIFEDKAALCKRYNLTYDPEDWPAHGILPQQFLADRGEVYGKKSEQLSDGLAVNVAILPGYRPDWKPLVECGFKLTHQPIADLAPGYDPPRNAERRCGVKYEKDAALTLEEFKAFVLEIIVARNRKIHRDFALSPTQVLQGVRPIPIELWNHDVRSRIGLMNRFPEEQVRFELLPRGKATVTDAGIRLNGCLYTCSEAVRRGWFVLARKKQFTVPASWDHRRVDEICVHDPAGRGWFVATLHKDQKHFLSMSVPEVAYYRSLQAGLTKGADEHTLQVDVAMEAKVAPMIDAARQATARVSRGKTRSARKNDTVAARTEELARERQQTVRMPVNDSQARGVVPSAPANIVALYPAATQTTGSNGVDPAESTTASPLTLQQKLAQQRSKMLGAR